VRRTIPPALRPGRLLALSLALSLAGCAVPRVTKPEPPTPPVVTDGAFTMADGQRLPYREWLPAGEPQIVVLALHGIDDSRDAWERPAPLLAAQGIAVVAPDERGFGATLDRGTWPGTAQMLADARAMALDLRARFPAAKLYLMGESMGGAVMMAASVEKDPPIADGMILVAPAVWGLQTQSAFNRNVLDLAIKTVPWMTVVPTGLRVRASSSNRALVAMARDPLVIKETRVDAAYGLVDLMTRAYAATSDLKSTRTLVLFGLHEAILSRSAVAQMLQRLPKLPANQLRVALYPRGYHLLLRDWDALTVYDDISAWLSNPAAPLPSGADAPRPVDARARE